MGAEPGDPTTPARPVRGALRRLDATFDLFAIAYLIGLVVVICPGGVGWSFARAAMWVVGVPVFYVWGVRDGRAPRRPNGPRGRARSIDGDDGGSAEAEGTGDDEAVDGAPSDSVEHAEQLHDALQTLVDLKDGPRDDAYRAGKERAWATARALLAEEC